MEYGKRANRVTKTIPPSCAVTMGTQRRDMASAIDLLEKMSELYIVKKRDCFVPVSGDTGPCQEHH